MKVEKEDWTRRKSYLCLSFSKWGRFMLRSLGRIWMKTLLTQGVIVCVCGVRKWTFKTTTVTHMLRNFQNLNLIWCWKSKNFLPECIKNHGKKYKFSEKRNNQWGGRDDLCEQQEEHSQGEKDADWKTNLIAKLITYSTLHCNSSYWNTN